MDLESINVKFYLTKRYKEYFRKFNSIFGPLEAFFHEFHIAQSIIAKVKTHELQEVRTFLDHLPKRGNFDEQQRQEHRKYIESIVVKETTLGLMPTDIDLFELQFLMLRYKEWLWRMCTPVRLSMFNLVQDSLCFLEETKGEHRNTEVTDPSRNSKSHGHP